MDYLTSAECAKKWNAEQKDGRTDWTARQVEIYRHENRMSWHEHATSSAPPCSSP